MASLSTTALPVSVPKGSAPCDICRVTLPVPVISMRGSPRVQTAGRGTLTGSAVVDSEAMVAYRMGAGGVRTAIDVPFWPRLTAASTSITTTGTVTNIKVFPRWWGI
jgi:hypothetical protein